MKKKIHKKLSTSENPIYTEFSHEHLTTCDFRAGIIYHYYDPENEKERRLLDVYKLKKADMDMDLEMLAKNQFKKEYKASDYPFKSSAYSDILDISRGTNPKISRADVVMEIESTVNHMDGIIQTATISGLGKRSFSDLFFILSVLSESINKSLYWMERAYNAGQGDSEPMIKYFKKKLSADMLVLIDSGYALDIEGYMHPLDDDDINLNSEYAIKLNKQIFSQVIYEFTESDKDSFNAWKKRQINLPF